MHHEILISYDEAKRVEMWRCVLPPIFTIVTHQRLQEKKCKKTLETAIINDEERKQK